MQPTAPIETSAPHQSASELALALNKCIIAADKTIDAVKNTKPIIIIEPEDKAVKPFTEDSIETLNEIFCSWNNIFSDTGKPKPPIFDNTETDEA